MSDLVPAPEKSYCPYCDLPLKGNQHENNTMAWDLANCEYDKTVDEKPPVPELSRNWEKVAQLREKRLAMTRAIRRIEKRNEEITHLRMEIAPDDK